MRKALRTGMSWSHHLGDAFGDTGSWFSFLSHPVKSSFSQSLEAEYHHGRSHQSLAFLLTFLPSSDIQLMLHGTLSVSSGCIAFTGIKLTFLDFLWIAKPALASTQFAPSP